MGLVINTPNDRNDVGVARIYAAGVHQPQILTIF